MTKLRWGVISTARIGLNQVIPAMQQCEHARVEAIASRNRERAQQAADELGIAKAYGSYKALLADPDIDAVYNPLPNHLHVPLSLQALEAGKHVLCEKPLGRTRAEAQLLLDAARAHPNLKVMEAFMYRFHPQWQKAKTLVEEGQVGALRHIHSHFSYMNRDPENVRNQADIGGGGLLDIGCYCISAARYIFDAEPDAVMGQVAIDPAFATDYFASGLLKFTKGSSSFSCSTQLAPYQRVDIFGTEGRLSLLRPFNAPADRGCKLELERGDSIETIETKAVNQYTLQSDAFSRAVLEDSPVPTPLEDALANMQVIDRVFKSAETKGWA